MPSSMTTTEHGLELDERFGTVASDERLGRTADALRARGYTVHVADDAEQARRFVLELVPTDAEVFTMASQTLKALGVDEEINSSGRFKAIRPQIYAMDFATQKDDIRKLGASAAVTIGSVHAITDDGRMVTASGSGSQLALYAFGSEQVIYVVGAQKLVSDLDEAFERIQRWSWPLEDVRLRKERGEPSTVLKTLIVDGEYFPGRSSIVLVRAALGF